MHSFQPSNALAGNPPVPRFLIRNTEPARGWDFLSSGDNLKLDREKNVTWNELSISRREGEKEIQ